MNKFTRSWVSVRVFLRHLVNAIAGRKEWQVDCDAPPPMHHGYVVLLDETGLLPNRTRGVVSFRVGGFSRHYVSNQDKGGFAKPDEIWDALQGRLAMVPTAHFVDFFRKNPRLYPPEWVGQTICFMGTKYLSTNLAADGGTQTYVMALFQFRRGLTPSVEMVSLDYEFPKNYPAIILKAA